MSAKALNEHIAQAFVAPALAAFRKWMQGLLIYCICTLLYSCFYSYVYLIQYGWLLAFVSTGSEPMRQLGLSKWKNPKRTCLFLPVAKLCETSAFSEWQNNWFVLGVHAWNPHSDDQEVLKPSVLGTKRVQYSIRPIALVHDKDHLPLQILPSWNLIGMQPQSRYSWKGVLSFTASGLCLSWTHSYFALHSGAIDLVQLCLFWLCLHAWTYSLPWWCLFFMAFGRLQVMLGWSGLWLLFVQWKQISWMNCCLPCMGETLGCGLYGLT